MKKIVLSFFVFSIAFAANAQFTLTPASSTIQGSAGQQDIPSHATIKNTGTTKKTFVWYMIRKNFPGGWQSAVCDKNLCYDTSVKRATFELNPNESGILDLHLYPQNNAGSGCVDVMAFEQGDSANAKTASTCYTTWALGIDKIAQRNTIEVYPNPATTKLNIKLETTKPVTIEVYNILGQVKMTYTHNGGTGTMDVSELPSGIYFLRYTNDAGQLISKQFKKVQ